MGVPKYVYVAWEKLADRFCCRFSVDGPAMYENGNRTKKKHKRHPHSSVSHPIRFSAQQAKASGNRAQRSAILGAVLSSRKSGDPRGKTRQRTFVVRLCHSYQSIVEQPSHTLGNTTHKQQQQYSTRSTNNKLIASDTVQYTGLFKAAVSAGKQWFQEPRNVASDMAVPHSQSAPLSKSTTLLKLYTAVHSRSTP